jgi:hypothetical protein
MRFTPPRCPHTDCSAHRSHPFRFTHWGTYARHCDGREVQRFRCLECSRTFSSQSFRLDRGLQRPRLHLDLWAHFISKVTQRQSARMLGCSRKSVAHRLELLGDHCREYHVRHIARLAAGAGLEGKFLLDELETYEHSRRLQPVTVPVLIQRSSYFLVDLAAAPLPCRGQLNARDREKKAAREQLLGKRRSGSRQAVEGCLKTLSTLVRSKRSLVLQTDCKHQYVESIRRVLGPKTVHLRTSSKDKRDYANPLFPINHTLAMLRDGLSRLVRRTWAASKLRARLEQHLWIWVCWRNYVRGVTNRAPDTTPAMIVGAARRSVRREELLGLRVTGYP